MSQFTHRVCIIKKFEKLFCITVIQGVQFKMIHVNMLESSRNKKFSNGEKVCSQGSLASYISYISKDTHKLIIIKVVEIKDNFFELLSNQVLYRLFLK